MNIRNMACLLIALLLLSGCGGASPTAAPTAAPTVGSAGGNNSTGANGFNIIVTGSITATLDSTNAAARFGSDSDAGTSTLTFANNNSKQSVSLVFWGIQPASGTYQIQKLFDLVDKKGVTGLLVDNTNKMRTFTAGSGSLTLTVQDGKYSGSFDFAATGGEIGGNMNQNAAVKGSFSNVP